MSKFKEDFEKWYWEDWIPKNRPDYLRFGKEAILRKFHRKHLAEQWGVDLEFFDSVGLIIETDIGNLRFSDDDEIFYQSGVKGYKFPKESETRQEAQKQALTKAIEIYENN